MCDSFEWDEAVKIAEDNITYQELLVDMKRESGVIDTDETSELGKAKSQMGQVLAFKRNSSAEEVFKNALSCFQNESANYKITQSYYLHYLIDVGMKDEYLRQSGSYFGANSSLSKQLDFIITEGTHQDSLINIKYALYLFVRGLYSFRINELTGTVWKKLCNIEDTVGKKNKGWKYNGHPSELFFKYMRLISVARNERSNEEIFKEKMENCITQKGPAIEVINRFAEIEILTAYNNLEERSSKTMELCVYMKKTFLFLKVFLFHFKTKPDTSG